MKATVIGSQADKAMTRLVLLARAVMVIVLLLCGTRPTPSVGATRSSTRAAGTASCPTGAATND